MNHPEEARLMSFFFPIWAIFVISGLFFWFNKNAALKRRLFPYFMIAAALVMVIFVFFSGIPPQALFIVIPAVALISFLNIRSIKFCDSCGRTINSQNPFSPAEYCQKCGAKLK